MNKKAKWTFMVYLAGDNNLSTAGDNDLMEMRAVGSTPDVNVVVEFDNAGGRGTNRYHVQRDGVDEHLVSLGETDSGDPQTLIEYVSWAARNFPAERYALILWNHGGGWEPAEMDRIASEVGSKDYYSREATVRSATPLGKLFFRSSVKTIFELSTPQRRAICSDDGTGHSLDTVELGKVLVEVKKTLGQDLDLLGMDACLMSNFEVAYQAQPYVKYIVASEESEPNNGWPYDAVLGELVKKPDMSTSELAAHIVNAYTKYYVDRNYTGPVTQSALDLSKVKALSDPLDKLAEALISHMPEASREIWSAQRNSVRFWHNTLWDIAHFNEELVKLTRNAVVRKATEEVGAALKPGPQNFVIAESHYGANVERCGGISIYLLSPLNDISQYYADLAYAKEHRWLDMLKAYHQA
ncbi:MAG: clostripain-related cysteine peptidase [Desulfobacteria bacterium]